MNETTITKIVDGVRVMQVTVDPDHAVDIACDLAYREYRIKTGTYEMGEAFPHKEVNIGPNGAGFMLNGVSVYYQIDPAVEEGQGGFFVDGLHVPEHGLYGVRGGPKWGVKYKDLQNPLKLEYVEHDMINEGTAFDRSWYAKNYWGIVWASVGVALIVSYFLFR